jgi:3-deoxy-D-manno-octulosonate 8-phosphate phosphatase (KDO 8-P phosphatase)
MRAGLVSGRASEVVSRRADELGMAVVRQGVRDKGRVLREVLDLPILTEAGLYAAPADAPLEVRLAAFVVTDARGGHGCLRELVEAILRARGDWGIAAAAVGASLPG